MKKILFSILFPLAALLSASLWTGRLEVRGHDNRGCEGTEVRGYENRLCAESNLVPSHPRTPAPSNNPVLPNNPDINKEIGYYMERHNMQDEGYEMVVAFAGGKRHQVSIDQHVSAWNVGRWEGHRREGTALALDSRRLYHHRR